jgi:hypothetical protein
MDFMMMVVMVLTMMLLQYRPGKGSDDGDGVVDGL